MRDKKQPPGFATETYHEQEESARQLLHVLGLRFNVDTIEKDTSSTSDVALI